MWLRGITLTPEARVPTPCIVDVDQARCLQDTEFGGSQVRGSRAQAFWSWDPHTLDLGLQGNPPTKIRMVGGVGLKGQQAWEDTSEAFNAWCRNPLPSFSLVMGAFGAMGTAFEELGRGPACMSRFFFSLVSSFSCFSSPFPSHDAVGEEVTACSWGPPGRSMAWLDLVGGSEIGLWVGSSEHRAWQGMSAGPRLSSGD